jgi:hypothetical protein
MYLPSGRRVFGAVIVLTELARVHIALVQALLIDEPLIALGANGTTPVMMCLVRR